MITWTLRFASPLTTPTVREKLETDPVLVHMGLASDLTYRIEGQRLFVSLDVSAIAPDVFSAITRRFVVYTGIRMFEGWESDFEFPGEPSAFYAQLAE